MTAYAYRFEDMRISNGFDLDGDPYPGSRLGIQCLQFPIVKRTPKGMWIDVWSAHRFVLLTANKRYADPCKQQAWADFKHRKKRQAQIYRARATQAEEAVVAAELSLEDAVQKFNMNGGGCSMQLDHDFLDRLEEYGPIARTLSQCLRPTFAAEHDDTTLVWGDWSAIEARMLPWLANNRGSNAVLDVFRTVDADPNAADIYMIEAGNIRGMDADEINARIQEGDKEAKGWRQEGKVAVLALGFGGGVGALMAMAVGYGLHFSEEEAQRIVDVWRENNRWAKRFWDELNEAFFTAYENPGLACSAGRVTYVYDPAYHGGTTFCVLPCGRMLTYPKLKYREVERTNRKTGGTYKQKVMTYRKGYKWGAVWHGILTENPTQASAASVLRAKLRHLDHAGQAYWAEEGERGVCHWEKLNNAQLVVDRAKYELMYGMEVPECQLDTRFHTHDEIGVECYGDEAEYVVQYLKRVMDKPLSWSDGLPLVSEMTTHWAYTKSLD